MTSGMHMAPVAAENRSENASSGAMEQHTGASPCSTTAVPGQTAAAVAARR